MGGLPKKATQVERILADSGLPHLVLDAGNLLFKNERLSPGQEETERLTAGAIAEAYSRMGYSAVGVGSRDLAAGTAFLQSLAKRHRKLPWLSANLVDRSSRKPLFRDILTVTTGSLQVAIIGLTGPSHLADTDNATLLPWEEVLPGLLARAAKRHDFVALLSSLDASQNQRLASQFPGVHLLLQSGAGANAGPPWLTSTSLIAATQPQGKQIGVLDITWQGSRRWQPQGQASSDQEKNHAPPLSTYSHRLQDVEGSLPDQPEVKAILVRLEEAISQKAKQRQAGKPPDPSPYLGHPGCATCHPEEFAAWRTTRHAKAYQTLVNTGQHENPKCLICHVTGIKPSQADEALALGDDRRGVGCEVCHGPGRQHAAEPSRYHLTTKLVPPLCLGCHNAPHTTPFDFDRRLEQIRHRR